MKSYFRCKPIYLLIAQAIAFSAQAEEAPAALDTITIFGQGQTRQVQNITLDDLQKALPGTSALKSLEKLPGVSFQSADPFGVYEWSTRFSVRGFAQQQLGFTLDGVPLGDMSYGNNNGLHISRAISSENIGRATISQGAGAVGTASTSNLGGTVQFLSIDPTDTLGGAFAQTMGSDKTSRTSGRFETGLLPSGTKAYISVTRQRTDKYKGAGFQDQDQVNTKVVQKLGGQSKLSAFYDYSDRKEIDYQDVSIEMVRRLGYHWDNYEPDFQRSINAARGQFTGAVNSLDDAYYQASGIRRDHLAGATLDLALTDSISWKNTAYTHRNRGQGHWYTPYVGTPGGLPISIRTTEYNINRYGIISDLTAEIGGHTINGGFWYENNLHDLARRHYAVTDASDTNYYLSNPFLTVFQQQFKTKTTQFYLQDEVALTDALKLNVGFKAPKVTIDAAAIIGTRAAGSLTSKDSFLPQAGLNYALSKNDEFFLSAAQNMRAFQPGVGGPFSQTQTAFNLGSGNLKPETSTTYDVGYRFNRESVTGSVAVYHADFKNRLLSVATCVGIVGCPNTLVNVGKVETNGVETAAVLKLSSQWSWFNSATYNQSKYKSNYTDRTTIVAISGKQVIDTPETMLNTELTYDDGSWFARVGGKFTGVRYYSYTNDAQVPSYLLANASAGYKLKNLGALKETMIQLNVTNVTNKKYYSTIGSNGFVKSDPNGTEQTLLTGAPRQFFITFSANM